MNTCVIGGTGHIGRNLVSMLLDEGWPVTVITSGRTPAPSGGKWSRVTFVRCRYGDTGWAECLQQQRPEVLIDILGTDAPATYQAVKSTCRHFILCGSIWMFGEPRVVPTPDDTQNPCLFDGYARRYEQMRELKKTTAADGLAFSAVMPPNICGPGKIPLDGLGGRSIELHKAHQRGDPVPLPAPGSTLISPCDAFDVAQGFFLAARQRDAAADQIFNVGADYALTVRQFIETYGEIYGVKIPIDWCSWQRYSEEVSPDPCAHFHFRAHMYPDLTKIKTRLGYGPRYTCEQSMERAVTWMREQEMI